MPIYAGLISTNIIFSSTFVVNNLLYKYTLYRVYTQYFSYVDTIARPEVIVGEFWITNRFSQTLTPIITYEFAWSTTKLVRSANNRKIAFYFIFPRRIYLLYYYFVLLLLCFRFVLRSVAKAWNYSRRIIRSLICKPRRYYYIQRKKKISALGNSPLKMYTRGIAEQRAYCCTRVAVTWFRFFFGKQFRTTGISYSCSLCRLLTARCLLPLVAGDLCNFFRSFFLFFFSRSVRHTTPLTLYSFCKLFIKFSFSGSKLTFLSSPPP